MNWRLPEALTTLVLAYCFSSLADVILQRQSRSVRDWNESLLIGIAIATALLFPLTLVTPQNALAGEAIILFAAAVVRTTGRREQRQPFRFPRPDWPSVAFAVPAVVMAVVFIIQNLRVSYNWDGFQIWATKAFLLYKRGGMTRDFMEPGVYDRVLDYPFAVPLFEALIPFVRGAFDWEGLKPVFAFFYVSMLVSTYYAARALVSAPLAWAATGLLSLLPAVSTGTNLAGYADMPQAAFVAAAVGSVLYGSQVPRTSFQHPFAWLLGGVLFVKSEGILLTFITVLTIVIMWVPQGPRSVLIRVREYWRPITLVGTAIALRICSTAWIGGHDPTYGPVDVPHIVRAGQIFKDVVALCWESMSNRLQWGIFWPVCLACALLLLFVGRRSDKAIALGTLLALAAYTSIFLFSNWEPRMHVTSAYERLLSQIAPVGALVLVCAYNRLRPAYRGGS